MADSESGRYYNAMIGTWELDCGCGGRHLWEFKPDLTYKNKLFPNDYQSRVSAEMANDIFGEWRLADRDWPRPGKQLWLNVVGNNRGSNKALDEWLSKLDFFGVANWICSWFPEKKSGMCIVEIVDDDHIRIQMEEPCGGTLRRIKINPPK